MTRPARRTGLAVSDPPTFVVPFLDNYSRMARALANSLRFWHPDSPLVAMTVAPAGPRVREVADACFDELLEFDDPGFDACGYSAVVWTRLHLWDIASPGPVVCLDADIQMYAPLGAEVIEGFHGSGKIFGSILDGMSRLRQQFQPGQAGLGSFGDAPAPCVAYLMLTPRPGVTEELLDLARRYDGATICPEQAILGLHAAQHGGWLDQTSLTVTQSWSPEALLDPPPTPLIHFGSPRPDFFGPSPQRQGDLTMAEGLHRFESRTGQPYPVERFRRDFEKRFHADLADPEAL
jgi:hypothetical protein